MNIERNTSKTFRLRFNSMRNSGHPGPDRHCNGIQLKRGLYRERAQRLLLFSQTAGSMVSAGDRFVVNHKKSGLPQTPPVHLPDHDLYFPVIDNSHVPRIQQKGRRGSPVVDLWRFLLPAFRAGKVHSGPVYCKVACETSRQVEKFCLRLFAQPDCPGFLFHSHFVSARFWNRNGYFCGHFHHAFYSRAQEKISGSFNPGNSPFYCLSDFNRRIPDSKNHCLPESVGRPFGNRVSSHTVFLRFWKRRFLGHGFGRKFTKTFSSSRSSHGFYLFRHRRRVGFCRNYGDCSPVLNFHLERFFDRLPGEGSLWDTLGHRVDPADRITGFYKPGSSFGSPPYKGVDLAFYKHGRVVDAGDDAFRRRNTKYFRASCKTLMMN